MDNLLAPTRYDSKWKEVKLINGHAVLMAYTTFAMRGLGFLAVTWSTVVLLGGFVSMIDKQDFWNLTVITLVQLIWIDDSFMERVASAFDLFVSSNKEILDIVTGNFEMSSKAHAEHPELPIVFTAIRVLGCVILQMVKNLLFCLTIGVVMFILLYGLFVTAWISICGLMEHDHYGDADEDRTNMDPAHNFLYVMCLAEVALFLYTSILGYQALNMVKEVSQAYGFEDGGHAVSGYYREIRRGCLTNPLSAKERNLITYAVELMESKSRVSESFVSGTLIIDRLLTRQHSDNIINFIKQGEEKQQQQQLDLGKQTPLIKRKKQKMNKKRQQHQQMEQEIISQQHSLIKRLIGYESSTLILEQLLETMYSKHSHDRKMREAAARIVEHVADGILLEQFPRGVRCISSLIDAFEEYPRLQPSLSSYSYKDIDHGQENKQEETLSSESDSESESKLDSESNVYQSLLKESSQMATEIMVTQLRRRLARSKDNNTVTTTSKSESDNNTVTTTSKSESHNGVDPFHGYKELVLTGLRILWSLAGEDDNCRIISNTENLVSKIMAPISCGIVHRAGHSAWSAMVSERSLGVMLRLIVTAKGNTRADLRQQISRDEGAITTMERIVTCEECKGGELQMKAMQILTQVCMDETANIGHLTKVLISIFLNCDNRDGSIRETAGKTLVLLFLSTNSVASLLPKEENDKFVGHLAEILLQVGDSDTCKSAAEILEHLCIHYTENEQYLSTLKDTIMGLMPKVLREILSWLTGEQENPGYARSGTELESQVTTNNVKRTLTFSSFWSIREKMDRQMLSLLTGEEDKYVTSDSNVESQATTNKNRKRTSSSLGTPKYHDLHVALLSLCATSCDKLHLDLDRISLGGGDQGECVTFSIAMKMVQLNRDLVTADNLKAMKLITRMVIGSMKKLMDHDTIVERADLDSLMDSLASISESMLDLECSMVLAAGQKTIPTTADTLHSLVKQARQLHIKIKNQESEINVS